MTRYIEQERVSLIKAEKCIRELYKQLNTTYAYVDWLYLVSEYMYKVAKETTEEPSSTHDLEVVDY